MVDLVPPPAEMGDLLVRMTRREWPTTEAERFAWFAALGLYDGEPVPPGEDDQGSTSFRFGTPWPEVDGSGTTVTDGFSGLSLFCYNERVADGAAARAGLAALQAHLTDSFGPPVEEWGSTSEPACLWQPGPLMLELYCFQRHDSGVMVGLSPADRTTAYDVGGKASTGQSLD